MGKPRLIREAAAAAAIAGLSTASFAALPRPDPERQAVIASVKAQLKDPDSAEFKGVKKTSPGYWCGFVNAKNSYGGYTGYSVFYWHDGKLSLNNDLPVDMSDPKLC